MFNPRQLDIICQLSAGAIRSNPDINFAAIRELLAIGEIAAAAVQAAAAKAQAAQVLAQADAIRAERKAARKKPQA